MNANRLSSVRAYRQIAPRLHTAGQPTRDQLLGLGTEGIRHVINLALADSDFAVADEAAVLAAQGIGYHHLPIDFSAPSRADLEQFSAYMAAYEAAPLLVHCALNMRVSAMIFLDRVVRQCILPSDAWPDLLAIWTPTGPWQQLINAVLIEGGHAPINA